MKEKICGTCKHHKHIYAHVRPHGDGIKIEDGWACINEDSENAGCYTDYDDSCDEWE
jgi:hypothetical protein